MIKSLAFRTVLAASAATLMLVAVGWLSLTSLRDLMTSERQVNHAYEIVTAIEDVRGSLADVEASHRAAIVAPGGDVSADYNSNVMILKGILERLDSLVTNDEQRRRLAATQDMLRADLTRFDDDVLSSHDSGTNHHRALADLFEQMRTAQIVDLAARQQVGTARAGRAYTAIWIGIICGGVFMVGAGGLIGAGIVRRHVAERALRASETSFRAMFNAMVTGVLVADERATIVASNPAFAQMVGLTEPGLVGRSVADFVVLPSGPDPETIVEVGDRIAGRITQHDMRRADGRIVPIEISLSKFDVDGRTFFVGNLCDISQRREIDRMKDEFVSVVSHELRTPLTSVRGALQLVLADPPEFKDADQEPLLGIALNNCERLIRIINDILDVSKIEAGRIDLHLKDWPAAELATTAIQSVAEMARQASVDLALEIEDGIGSVRVDFDRMAQVLVNLLSNAVKFAPADSVVTLAARRDGASIAWSVIDRGPGIAEADIDKLFTKFTQLDGSATRRKGGTGLGLSIVKALVEQHGGSVSVESRVGEGATFIVRLPAVEEEAAQPLAIRPATPGTARRRSVLVVDDDNDIRRVLRKQLENAGYRVVEAADGDSAVAAAAAEQPDLITMDLVMPGIGGLSTIRRLAADPRTQAIPVVIVSALADSVTFDHEFAIVPKPVDGDLLRREIEHLIGRSSNATLLLAEDDDDLRDVLARSLARGGFDVVTAPDGDAARKLFDQRRYDAIVVDLHMPTVDGFAVIEHVRRSTTGPATPIVVVSGSNTGEGEARALQLGANLFLAKPVNPAALVQELGRLVA